MSYVSIKQRKSPRCNAQNLSRVVYRILSFNQAAQKSTLQLISLSRASASISLFQSSSAKVHAATKFAFVALACVWMFQSSSAKGHAATRKAGLPRFEIEQVSIKQRKRPRCNLVRLIIGQYGLGCFNQAAQKATLQPYRPCLGQISIQQVSIKQRKRPRCNATP